MSAAGRKKCSNCLAMGFGRKPVKAEAMKVTGIVSPKSCDMASYTPFEIGESDDLAPSDPFFRWGYMKKMLEDLRAGEMIIFSGRAYLGLGKEAFKSLFSIMPVLNRVITDDVEALGYHALILNWPTSTIIAVLVLK